MNKTLSRFFSKYPYADKSKFITESVFGKTEPGVFFGPVGADAAYIYTEDREFKSNENYTKYLTIDKPPPKFPKIWLGGGTVQEVQGKRHWEKDVEGKHDFSKFTYLSENAIDYDLNNFRVYVNDHNFFMSKLPVLSPGNRTDIAVWWNNGEPYYQLIFAVYLSTYCCGVGVEHLKFSDDVYPVVTSIMRFHVYFTTRRILRRLIKEKKSDLMREFGAGKDVSDNMVNIPREKKFLINHHSGQHHDRAFKEWMWRLNDDYRTHYRRFIPLKTDGFTKIGLQYLNESIEAYVYAVLGAQAKTRVSIVKKGAGSLESQQEFRVLVNDAVVNYSVSTWILNMNRSISDTNVTQNLAISPDTWLVPGSLTILKKKILGYNNLLRHASDVMKFGINPKVNYQAVHKQPKKLHQEYVPHLEALDEEPDKKENSPHIGFHTSTEPQAKENSPHASTEPQKNNELGIILVATAVVGYLFSKNFL